MELLQAVNPLTILSGFVVGLLVGLTGVGGGSLMTPLLILVFGAAPTTAVGTDLLYAAATKAVGALGHGRQQNVDWSIVGRLAVGSMPGAALALVAMQALGLRADTSKLVTFTLGVALLLSAAAVIGRPLIRRMSDRHAGERRRWTPAATVASGFVLGVLVTISSVGAGAIGATILLTLYPRSPIVRVVGSDIAHAVPLTLLAGAGHWLLGSIDWSMLLSLLVGSLPGIVIGSFLSSKAPEKLLRNLLAATLTLVGVRLVLS